jgi:hypothetical protein
MLAHRRQLLASFRGGLWRFRLRGLCVHTQRQRQRCPASSALHRDAIGLSRGSLINTGCALIGAARHLPLTGGDSGRGLIGAARRRLLPGGSLIGIARHQLFVSGNTRGDFLDGSSYQLLTGNDPVEA